MRSTHGAVRFARSAALGPRTVLRASRVRLAAAPDQNVIDSVQAEATNIYKTIIEPFDVFKNLVPKERSTKPMVLIIGNHSSGKSTLINHILGREEQKTGVAPTDDGFTIITRSNNRDVTTDGPALMSETSWGFGQLKPFGPALISHLVLKQRTLPDDSLLKDGMLIVDTPGMINTPGHQRAASSALPGAPAHTLDRGYDFLGAMKWFAQRADVIVLMFDPNNPGTTGETLDVLTRSLAGQDHKFIIAFNKVDQFDRVHDFARAYGTLTWNLAKVIHRKDLPRIYPMYTPLKASAGAASRRTTAAAALDPTSLHESRDGAPGREEADAAAAATATPAAASGGVIPLSEFERNRHEVVSEILRAGQRRLDNIVTELEETALKVRMAVMVTAKMRTVWRAARVQAAASLAACVLTPLAIGALLSSANLAPAAAAGAFVLVGVVSGGAALAAVKVYRQRCAELSTNVDALFREVYHKDLLAENLDVLSRWQDVRVAVLDAIRLDGSAVNTLPAIKPKSIKALDKVVEVDVRALRQRCAVEKAK